LHAPVHRAWRGPCRHWRTGEHRHAGSARGLGGTRPRAATVADRRAECEAAVRGPARAAVVRLAAGAALPGRRCGERGKFLLPTVIQSFLTRKMRLSPRG